MINPSAIGWIDKFFVEQKTNSQLVSNPNLFYSKVRDTGFIFGHITSLDTKVTVTGFGGGTTTSTENHGVVVSNGTITSGTNTALEVV